MKTKLTAYKPLIDPIEVSYHFKNILGHISNLGDLGNQEKKTFFEKVKSYTKSLVFSTDKTNHEKLVELLDYKSELEFQRINAREYQVKQINEVINKIISPAINNLIKRLELEKKFGLPKRNISQTIQNERKINCIQKDLIRINAAMSQEPEKNTSQSIQSEIKTNPIQKEFIRINSDITNEPENKTPVEDKSTDNNAPLIGIHSDKFDKIDSQEENKPSFEKIKMNLSKEETHKFFERLSRFKNELNNQPYLLPEDVEQLLNQSFINYTEKPVQQRILNLNLGHKQYGIMYSFIHEFYSKNQGGHFGMKKKYALFLKANFSCFNSLDLDTLYSSIRSHGRFNKIDLLDFKNYRSKNYFSF